MRFTKRALAALFLSWLIVLAPIYVAKATILWAGGEDIDIIPIGAITIDTTGGNFRSGWAREDIHIQGNGNANDPTTYRFYSQPFTAGTTVWFHFIADYTTSVTLTTNGQAFCFISPDGVCRLLLRGTGTAGQVKLSTRNAAGTITDLMTCTAGGWPIINTLTKTDIQVIYGTSGTFNMYSAGVNICTYSGNLQTDSATQINQVYIGCPTSQNCYFSEFTASTTDTRDMNLFSCYPTANGTNMAWTGAYTNVNPTTINDANSISTVSNNAVAEFICPSIPSGTYTVSAVVSSLRLQIGATGPQNFQFMTRPGSGSTDYFSGTIAGTATFGNNYQNQATNPATSGSWSTSDISGIQQGVKSIP